MAYPKKRRGRFGADARQEHDHDEVENVKDEEVSDDDYIIVVGDEAPPCSGRKRKQRDLTYGGDDDGASIHKQ